MTKLPMPFSELTSLHHNQSTPGLLTQLSVARWQGFLFTHEITWVADRVTQHPGGPGSSGHPAAECCVQPGAARGLTWSLSACVAVLWAYSNSHKRARWATGSSEVLHVTGMVGINYKNLLYNGVLWQKCW